MRRAKGEGSWDKPIINGTQYFRYRKKYNEKKKTFYGRTRKDVLEKIKKYESKQMIICEQDIAKMTVQTYLYAWLQNIRIYEVADGTYATDIQTYKSYIRDNNIGRLQIANLNYRVLQDYINSLAQQYSRSTIKKIYYLLNICFRYAVRVSDIDTNPCDNIVLPNEKVVATKKKKIPFLEQDDIDKLYNEAFRLNTKEFSITGAPGTRVYGVNALGIVIILYTGLRSAELLALQWKHIDFENKILSVQQAYHKKIDKETGKESRVLGEPKYNSKRNIPLADRAIIAFEEIKNNRDSIKSDDFVITAGHRRLSLTLERMLKRADCTVQKCGLHSLRHSFGSMLLANGVDLKTISTLLGHKDISTTANIYLDVTQDLATEAIDKLNK